MENRKKVLISLASVAVIAIAVLAGIPKDVPLNEVKVSKKILKKNDWAKSDIVKVNDALSYSNYEYPVSLPQLNSGEEYFFSVNPAGSTVSTSLLSELFSLYRDSNSRLTKEKTAYKNESSGKTSYYSKVRDNFKPEAGKAYNSLLPKILKAAGIKADLADKSFYVSGKGILAVKLSDGSFKNIATINSNFSKDFRSQLKMNFIEPVSVSLDDAAPLNASVSPSAISLFAKVDLYAGIRKGADSAVPQIFGSYRFSLS